jgi:formiminoglutamase
MREFVKDDVWTGRIDHLTRRSSLRYHQKVERLTPEAKDITNLFPLTGSTCALIGFACDEGVRRNQGRVGAAQAPNAIRHALASSPWRMTEDARLIDAGNVVCEGTALEEAQAALGHAVSDLLAQSATPIILGGGHETLYGHYLGIREHIGAAAKLGVINIDAHFDLRSYEEQPSSGTMFRQILEQDPHSDYMVVGIQRYGNTQELFDKAEELGAQYIMEEDMHEHELEDVLSALDAFIAQHDYVMLTLCTDVLNAAFAPGVSAPSPFGLSPSVVRTLIRNVAAHKQTLSFDISEVNPAVDEGGKTVKLGAYLVNEAVMALMGRGGVS